MFKFIQNAIDYVVAKVTAAYQAVVNFFFGKEEEKKETKKDDACFFDATAQDAVDKFNASVEEDSSVDNVSKAFLAVVSGEVVADATVVDVTTAYSNIVSFLKGFCDKDAVELRSMWFSYYTTLRPVLVKTTEVCGLDISTFDAALASLNIVEK